MSYAHIQSFPFSLTILPILLVIVRLWVVAMFGKDFVPKRLGKCELADSASPNQIAPPAVITGFAEGKYQSQIRISARQCLEMVQSIITADLKTVSLL
jgi:hypothetical protein